MNLRSEGSSTASDPTLAEQPYPCPFQLIRGSGTSGATLTCRRVGDLFHQAELQAQQALVELDACAGGEVPVSTVARAAAELLTWRLVGELDGAAIFARPNVPGPGVETLAAWSARRGFDLFAEVSQGLAQLLEEARHG